MLINWLLWLCIPYWQELIVNPLTGKPSAKNLFAAGSFVVGIGGAVVSIAADIMEKRPVGQTAILLLLGNGGLLAGMKVYQSQMNRRTADDAGNPLAVSQPASPAPEIMEQVENPNVPAVMAPAVATTQTTTTLSTPSE